MSVLCEVNGFMVPAIIDTGAEITVMSASCAKRCGLSSLVDTQHSGKAVGVGSTEILGGIEGLPLRIGPLSFQNKVSILSQSRCDFLIGLDVLKRFKCEISLRERLLRLHVRNEEVRISLSSAPGELHEEGTKTLLTRPVHPACPLKPDLPTDPAAALEDTDYDEDCLDYYDDRTVSMEGV